MSLCLEFDVPVILTSYGNPTPLVKRAHEKKCLVFHDVISLAHGKKAVAAGVDGIIAVSAGGGRARGSNLAVHAHSVAERGAAGPDLGRRLLQRRPSRRREPELGAELCYLGTRFIASTECGAADDYKNAVVAAGPEDILYTDKVSGIHANFIKSTVPEGFEADRSPEGSKRWKDIWSAGQGVAQIKNVKPMARSSKISRAKRTTR